MTTKLLTKVKEGKEMSTSELRHFYFRRHVLNDANVSSDWPFNYSMILKVIISSLIPAVINAILQLLP